MTGSARPLFRYAAPSSRRKRVGEIVSRPVFGLSTPRGASAPPQTRTSGAAAFSASYVAASRRRYAGAEAPVPLSVELRQPEAVEVRLVADDHVAEARIRLRDRGRVGGELLPLHSRVSGVVREPAL